MKQALYLIPYPKFFSQHAGVGGHIAHAAGIVEGMASLDFEIKVIVEENHEIFDIDNVFVDELTCSSQSFLSRQLWTLKLLRHIRALTKQHKYEFCYIRYSASFAPWIPRLKKALGKIPLILEVNSLGSQWRSWFNSIDRRALKSVDRVICISDVLQEHIQLQLGLDKLTDMRTVINGVNPKRFEIEPIATEDTHLLHIGFAGLLKADYGIETLIEAAKLLKSEPVKLHVFGDGPYRAELEQQAKELKNVTFHGPVPFVSMPAYLLGLDVLLYTTAAKHLYQSPTKLFEYMAAGKAIISTRTPQTEKILTQGETALFFDVGSAEQLAVAIKQVNSDSSMAKKIAQQAKIEAVTKHSWSSRVHEILA